MADKKDNTGTFLSKLINEITSEVNDWLYWDKEGSFWDQNRWYKIVLGPINFANKWIMKVTGLYQERMLELKPYRRTRPVRWYIRADLGFDPHRPYTIDEFLALPTWQHRRPNYMRVLEFLIEPLVCVMNTEYFITTRQYNINTSVGVELDVIGKWVGVSREVFPPFRDNMWLTFDHKRMTGWNRGIWKDTDSPFTGLALLPDHTYRFLLKAKIVANSWDGTIEHLYEIWYIMLGNEYGLQIRDNLDMSIDIWISSKENDSILRAILRDEKLPIRPVGVKANVELVSFNGPVMAWIEEDGPVISGIWDKAKWHDFGSDEYDDDDHVLTVWDGRDPVPYQPIGCLPEI